MRQINVDKGLGCKFALCGPVLSQFGSWESSHDMNKSARSVSPNLKPDFHGHELDGGRTAAWVLPPSQRPGSVLQQAKDLEGCHHSHPQSKTTRLPEG